MVTGVDLIGMNIFQLRELSAAVSRRITEVAGSASIPAVSAPSVRTTFKHGDLIEFTAKSGRTVRAMINRLNDKSIGCQDVVTKGKWRVGYGLARLVGADKPGALPPPAKLPIEPFKPMASHETVSPSIGAASTADHAGGW